MNERMKNLSDHIQGWGTLGGRWWLVAGLSSVLVGLSLAAGSFALVLVGLLLAVIAAVQAKRASKRTLHWAAFCGRKGVVVRLLAAGADVNHQDQEGKTPLHEVASWAQHSFLMSSQVEDSGMSSQVGDSVGDIVREFVWGSREAEKAAGPLSPLDM